MIRWGVTAGSHDGAIAVFENDNLIFASDAERFSKKKNDSDISALQTFLLNTHEPDEIYFYENPYLKATRRWYAGQKPYLKLPNSNDLLFIMTLEYTNSDRQSAPKTKHTQFPSGILWRSCQVGLSGPMADGYS